VFSRLASPITLAFLADYPTPRAAARLGEARMASFCRRHSYRGGKPPAVLLARLGSAPTAPVGIPPATLATLIGTQVQLLCTLLVTIAELEAAIKQRVAQHPRAKLLVSLPGVGTINLAQLLAEVGPILDRVDSAEHAAAECRAGHQGLGQDQRGLFPLGRQPSRRQGPDRLRPQLPVGLALGRAPVCRRPGPRQAQPARHPHRRSCLAPGHLGLLAASHPLQPRPAHRRASSCSAPNLTQETQAAR
jgi:hypothetical protein